MSARKVKPPIAVGATVWFLKSMRMCTVADRHKDDTYTVRALDSGKSLHATRDGICLETDSEALRDYANGLA